MGIFALRVRRLPVIQRLLDGNKWNGTRLFPPMTITRKMLYLEGAGVTL
jgi:hypothetical protein